MKAALFHGKTAPTELGAYNLEALFWSKLGVRATNLPLDLWPEEKVRRYLVVMQQVAVWDESQMELARRRASADAARGGR